MDYKSLIEEAVKARELAYTPYSHFRVGAALVGKSGKIYHGCNVENAAYTPTNCAERTAFFKAVSEGEREFSAIAIVGGKEGELSPLVAPCGVCRQVMAEFCDDDFIIVLGTPEKYSVHKFSDLLPYSFSKKNLD